MLTTREARPYKCDFLLNGFLRLIDWLNTETKLWFYFSFYSLTLCSTEKKPKTTTQKNLKSSIAFFFPEKNIKQSPKHDSHHHDTDCKLYKHHKRKKVFLTWDNNYVSFTYGNYSRHNLITFIFQRNSSHWNLCNWFNYFIEQAPTFIRLACNKETSVTSISVFKIKVPVGMSCSYHCLSSLHCRGTKSKNLLTGTVSFMLRHDFVKQAGTGSTERKRRQCVYSKAVLFTERIEHI